MPNAERAYLAGLDRSVAAAEVIPPAALERVAAVLRPARDRCSPHGRPNVRAWIVSCPSGRVAARGRRRCRCGECGRATVVEPRQVEISLGESARVIGISTSNACLPGWKPISVSWTCGLEHGQPARRGSDVSACSSAPIRIRLLKEALTYARCAPQISPGARRPRRRGVLGLGWWFVQSSLRPSWCRRRHPAPGGSSVRSGCRHFASSPAFNALRPLVSGPRSGFLPDA